MTLTVLEKDKVVSSIYEIRGVQVLLNNDLAKLYKVETKTLNQTVKRNISRFPTDFMFRLTKSEWETLRSQIVALEQGKGNHPKYLPYAFTESGVAMLSSVQVGKAMIAVVKHGYKQSFLESDDINIFKDK